jgi:CheY-like chemotaxis protein
MNRTGEASRVVLVVDDDPITTTTMRRLLELDGYDARVAYSGLQAVEAAHRCQPDAVICDINLPGMSGWEVARALRQGCSVQRTYMIALTGDHLDGRTSSKESGFDLHLVKPVDPQELSRILAKELATGLPVRGMAPL